jgi:hypothetical protein
VKADTVRTLISPLFLFLFPSSSSSSRFSLSGLTRSLTSMPWRHSRCPRHVRDPADGRPTCRWGQDQHRILYRTSPIDAPRRELSVDIPHVTRTAVARSPYNFRLYYDHSSLAPLALLAGNAQPGFNFSLEMWIRFLVPGSWSK